MREIDRRMPSSCFESSTLFLSRNFANKGGTETGQMVHNISIMYVAIIVIIAQVAGN